MKPRRSVLSMPADREKYHAKADTIGADEVMFDLEDSVTASNKGLARRQIAASLRSRVFRDRIVAVRVNAVSSEWFELDLEAAAQCGRVDAIVIPKVNSTEDVHRVEVRLRALGRMLALEPQIETAQGLLNAASIAAASPHVEALHFGPLDMSASLGMPISGATMADDVYTLCLFQVLVAGRSCHKQVIDGPYPAITDSLGLRRSAERAARIGFDGKWAVHPDQVPIINEAFTPSEPDRLRARSILDAYSAARSRGAGAITLNGEMLDEAVVRWAETTISRAVAATRGIEEGTSDATGRS